VTRRKKKRGAITFRRGREQREVIPQEVLFGAQGDEGIRYRPAREAFPAREIAVRRHRRRMKARRVKKVRKVRKVKRRMKTLKIYRKRRRIIRQKEGTR
jgi:hypothetical protein